MASKVIPRLVLLSLISFGFFPGLRAERLPIKTYTTADGLPRDHINRIVQDSRGFLWFCTSEGLSRFDGYKFTNYGTEQGLPGREVNDFLETRSGIYWVATDKGLARFNPDPLPTTKTSSPQDSQRFVVYRPGDERLALETLIVYEDHAGTIWCGTSAGLFRLDQTNGRWEFSFVDIIKPATQDNDKAPRSIIEDRRHSLWIGAESGLYRVKPDGVVERYSDQEGLPKSGNGVALCEDGDGRIWVGTIAGLFELVPDAKPGSSVVAHVYTTRDGLSHNWINSLTQSDGRLWVGTARGVSEFLPPTDQQAGRFQSYGLANGLSDVAVTTVAEDGEQNLWIGTETGGAMRLARNGFTTYAEPDGLATSRIASIFENFAGDLFVMSGNNVSGKIIHPFDGRKFIAIRPAVPKEVSYYGWGWNQWTFQDHLGEWWVATQKGLYRFPKVKQASQLSRTRPQAVYTTLNGLPANDIFRLFEDSRGDIWISTVGNPQGVLTRWERATETFHRYSPADGIPEAAPTAFSEDRAGNLWIGFYVGGLLRYRAGSFTPFNAADGVPSGLVNGMYLDHAGRLWVATGEGGLARVDNPDAERPNFQTYSTAQGLSSNQAKCITEDQAGMIYVGTGRGVNRLDPANGYVKHFTTADGLANSFINVSFRRRDGSLWFGTLQGLSRFFPQPEPPTLPPRILVNSLRIAGIPYPLSELGAKEIAGLVLDPTENNIEINFSGLSLAAGESLRYQYKLEGTSSEWSTPTDQRNVNYPNLPAGRYRFLVRAVTTDGTFSTSPAIISFRVLSPVWRRWWFILTALVLVSIPFTVVARFRRQRIQAEREAEQTLQRSREERLKALEQVRRRIATDLHDDIGSSLSQINLLSEVVRQRVGHAPEIAEPLRMISNTSNEMVSSMSDIVWAINPQRDHLSDLVHRMRRFAADTLAARDIKFQFRAPDAEFDPRLGANLRREVFLIFKESLNNVVKHAGCTEAEIAFQMSDHSLFLKVSDNGRGFDAGRESHGHGLGSLRERAGSIGGRLEVTSKVGEGTTVTLSVPLSSPEPTNSFGGNDTA